ncbi:hypothetical protein F4811DRAFT_525894 [Daldinia bambusicola]|nr:hypothetical protein F4811DRAFT_525894 [Daldinia bambusicola]
MPPQGAHFYLTAHKPQIKSPLFFVVCDLWNVSMIASTIATRNYPDYYVLLSAFWATGAITYKVSGFLPP